MKNVLVGQSGGPTAVINSSLAGVYETAKACGAPHVYGMQYGIEGVLEGKLIDLDTVLGDKMDIELLKRIGKIKQQVKVPLVADIHFDYQIALRVAELGVDCLRINPGNIGREDRVRAVVDAARDRGIPIRIGVNAGSLEKELQKKG